MPKIKRHSHAAKAAKLFVESLFTEPGVTIASADLTRRADRAGVAASSSVVVNAAQNLVKSGWLEQPARGFYRRPETTGPALISEPVPPSTEAIEVARLAGISHQIRALDEKVETNFRAMARLIVAGLGLSDSDLERCRDLAKSRAIEHAHRGDRPESDAFHALVARIESAKLIVGRFA